MDGEGMSGRPVLRNTMLFPRQFHEDAMALDPLDRLAFYDAILDYAYYDRVTEFEDRKLEVLYRYAVSRMRPALEKFDAKHPENFLRADGDDEDAMRRHADIENTRERERIWNSM